MSGNDNLTANSQLVTATTKAVNKPSLLPSERYNVLVEFAHKHLDFQLSELESVLDMHGISLHDQENGCLVVPLPNADKTNQGGSVLEGYSGNSSNKSKEKNQISRSFVILSFPSGTIEWTTSHKITLDENYKNYESNSASQLLKKHDLIQILHQCTLVRSAMVLWGMGNTLEECAAQTREWVNTSSLGKSCWNEVCGGQGTYSSLQRSDRDPTINSTSSCNKSSDIAIENNTQNLPSWKITIHTLGSKYTRNEQDAMRKQFAFLDFPGPVKLEDPTYEFVLIREIELDSQGSVLYPRHSHLLDENGGKLIHTENDARPPLACYFGLILGGARTLKGRGGFEQYNLKKRAYLGPTSMDAELSFIMTNLGQVRRGSFCFDPFVGTGSILLSCAIRGAYCFGTDIDIRVLRGMNKESNVFSNFDQFHLPRPDLVRCDNSIYHRHFRNHLPMYDAIICDPPYGIRAGARRSGSRLANPRPVEEDQRHDHIAQTKPYPVSDVMSDLLDVAARTLVMKGRLVYVIPSFAAFDVELDLPQHECLEMLHTCFQPLTLELGRRIVTMRKIKHYDPNRQLAYMAAVWKNGPESAEKCVNLRDKINESAKKKPGYADKLQFRKQKRKEHKELKKRAKMAKEEESTNRDDHSDTNASEILSDNNNE